MARTWTMWRPDRIRAASLAMVIAAATTLAAQARPAGPDSVMRRQMALAYLRVELAVRDRPIATERLGPLNVAFDQSTLAFFSGKYAAVVGSLDSVAAAIEVDTSVAPRHRTEARRALDAPSGVRLFLPTDSGPVPYRLYAPSSLGPGPAPLLVALHGAGTSEAAFLEGYGAGKLRDLAEAGRFVVATPFTNGIMRSAANLDRLIDSVAGRYRIDRGRVYLLGHSLGAMTAWRFAQERPMLVAGVVCLAGAAPVTAAREQARRLPRTLVVGAALDQLVAAARLKQAVDAARAIGWAVQYRELADYGHTLMVGAALADAIQWLLEGGPHHEE